MQSLQNPNLEDRHALEQVPSTFSFLGIRNETAGSVHNVHTPRFVMDEAQMPLGMRRMSSHPEPPAPGCGADPCTCRVTSQPCIAVQRSMCSHRGQRVTSPRPAAIQPTQQSFPQQRTLLPHRRRVLC